MFKVLFRDIMNGHLTRLSYLGYTLLVFLLVAGFAVAITLTAIIIGDNLHLSQEKLREWSTPAYFIVIGLAAFANLNIMVKRIRDTGLPGWWTLLAISVLQSTLYFTVSVQASSSLHTLFTFALLSIPTDAFIKN